MDFKVLGPLRVSDAGQPVEIGAGKRRLVLAVLLARAGRPVATEALVDAVWGEHPPSSARRNLQLYVHQLRRGLGGGVIVAAGDGYAIHPADGLDATRFRRLAADGGRSLDAGDPVAAQRILRAGLELWQGPAFGEFLDCRLVAEEAQRLELLRIEAYERWAEAQLACGASPRLAAELSELCQSHPYRESLRALLMRALYQTGRQAEALAAFRQARALLVDELGVEPGPALRRLHEAILRGDEVLVVAPAPSTSAHPAPVPRELPPEPAVFTGRARALNILDESLPAPDSPARPIVICGTAGVGKTALAVRWAQRIRGRFPDGQLYVNLRGYDTMPSLRAIDALARFLQAMGVPPGQVPVDEAEAAGMYRSHLAGRRMLILLDNANSAAQVRPLLPGDPACLVLVTSRDELAGLVARDGARRLTLDMLAPAEATTLLAELLGAQRALAEPRACAELARICAYLPLALRIAAAHLVGRAGLGVDAFVAELVSGDRLAGLEVNGDEEAAVGVAFDLSYRALVPEARRMFRLVGLVPGRDVTPESAAALSRTTPDSAVRLLRALAGAHLLHEHETARFGAHDLLRLYAMRCAEREDSPLQRAEALDRWYAYYQRSADRAARLLYPSVVRLPVAEQDASTQPAEIRDDTQASAWLEAERATMVAAIMHASVHGPRPRAWLLADALRGYLQLRMETVDWLTVAQASLSAAEADDDPLARAAAEVSLATLHVRRGEPTVAVAHFLRALELARHTGWVEGEAAALGNLGALHFVSGRVGLAADHYRQAAALNRRAGAVAGEAVNRINLGGVYWATGALEEAVDQFTEALALYTKCGARSGVAAALTGLAQARLGLGLLDQAAGHLAEALTLQQELRDLAGQVETRRLTAEVQRDAGNLTTALGHAEAAVTMARDLAFTRLEAAALATTGTVHHRLGRLSEATEHHRRALELARTVDATYTEAVALLGLATAEAERDRPAANDYARQALHVSRRAGYGALAAGAQQLITATTPADPT